MSATVLVGRYVVHLPEDETMAREWGSGVALCHVRGKQLQMALAADDLPGVPVCGNCARVKASKERVAA